MPMEIAQPERDDRGRFSGRSKGRRVLHISVRTAAEGLKAEIYASPSLWSRLCKRRPLSGEGCFEDESDNLSLEIEVWDMRSGKQLRYKLAEVCVIPGPESSPEEEAAPAYEDDGTLLSL
jgi:hypothetical protein